MFKNYLKVALRNLFRQRIYSVINILGLAIGLACSFLIILYIYHELNYDKFHKNYENIYRIANKGKIAGDFLNVAVSSGAMLPVLITDYPEVETGTRLNSVGEIFLSYENKKFYEDEFYFADSGFWEVFNYEMISGDPATALSRPYTMVLPMSTAKKYFGKENPIGKVIEIDGDEKFEVTGIVADPPNNSHFKFTGLLSFMTLYEKDSQQFDSRRWGSLSLHTYVRAIPELNTVLFEEKLSLLIKDKMEALMGQSLDSMNIEILPYLQSLESIHLHSNLMAELSDNNDITNIYVFGAIAIFILIIACINFMNLSTARSAKRAKEVGLRKVHGAEKKQLIFQFLSESVLISLIALIIAIVIVELIIPPFNQMLDVELTFNIFLQFGVFLLFVGISLFTGIFAGSYPAFYLSAFKPIKVLKGVVDKLPAKLSVRNTLVVLQFAVSIFLIICTIIIYNQIGYLSNKKLGFDKENVIIIPLRGERMTKNFEFLKNEFSQVPIIKEVSAGSSVPGFNLDGSGFIPEGMDENEPWLIYNIAVDQDYTESFGIEILQGRNFSLDYPTDTAAILINETLLKRTGWEDPIGKKFTTGNEQEVKVIGVVKDFHFKSLEAVIEPMIIFLGTDAHRFLNIKITEGDVFENINIIEKKWNSIESEFPFDYFFLDERLERLYKAEHKTGIIFIYFTFLAIFIACLGLFGMAAFIAQQRTKEIGIRKSLGASVNQLVFMLSKEFTKWVIISNIIAWPLAYYAMNYWLQNFAYTTKMTVWIFIASAAIALTIAIMTVSYQSYKTAIANPSKSLKYE
jgi:putative ABC transport system permease protein